MITKPFKIDAFPVGEANWIVIPDAERYYVQVRMEIGGGGEGPLVCEADWIPHRYERVEGTDIAAPGFLAWHIDGDTVFTAPTWLPPVVLRAVQEMAIWLHIENEKAKAVGA